MRHSDRETVLADVRADLLAAEADGRDPALLLGADVASFVRRTVEEGDYAQAPSDVGRMVLLGVVGAPVAVVVGYLFFLKIVWRVGVALVDLPFRAPHLGVAVGFTGITACGVLGAVGNVAVLTQTDRASQGRASRCRWRSSSSHWSWPSWSRGGSVFAAPSGRGQGTQWTPDRRDYGPLR